MLNPVEEEPEEELVSNSYIPPVELEEEPEPLEEGLDDEE